MERSHPWPLVGQHADDDIRVAPVLQQQMQEAGNTGGHSEDPGSDEQTTSQSNSPQWTQQQGMQEAREAQHANVVAKHDGANTWAPPWKPSAERTPSAEKMLNAADVYALTGGVVGAEGGPDKQPAEAQPPEPGKAGMSARDWALRLVDMKGVTRPQEFTGRQQDWYE